MYTGCTQTETKGYLREILEYINLFLAIGTVTNVSKDIFFFCF